MASNEGHDRFQAWRLRGYLRRGRRRGSAVRAPWCVALARCCGTAVGAGYYADAPEPPHGRQSEESVMVGNRWIRVHSVASRRWAVSVAAGGVFAAIGLGLSPALPGRADDQKAHVDALGDELPPQARLRLGTLRFRPPSSVVDMAITPDGKSVITAGQQLIVWDAATGKERWCAAQATRDFAHRPLATACALAMTSDGTQFFTPGAKNEIVVWVTLTGHYESLPIEATNMLPVQAQAIDASPDGQLMAVGGAAGLVVCNTDSDVLYTLANSAEQPRDINKDRLLFNGANVYARFSGDSKLLAVMLSESPQAVRLLAAATGEELRTIALKARLVRMAFSPDSKRLVATERDNAVRMYDVASGAPVWSRVIDLKNPYENYTSAVTFSPDGGNVAVCATDYAIYLFDGATGNEQKRLIGHAWYPWAIAFAPDGKLLYSSGWDSSIRRWNMADGKQLAVPTGVRGTCVVAASPHGRMLAQMDGFRSVRLYDGRDGRELRQLRLQNVLWSQLVFSPDGRQLSGGGSDDEEVHAAVWDLADGDLVQHWHWPKGKDPHSTIEDIAFSPDGKRLAAVVFRQHTGYLWNVPSGQQIARLDHHDPYGLSFSPDGSTLATAGWDSCVRFWDAASGAPINVLDLKEDRSTGRDRRIYTVRYAPEGDLLATAHLDGTVDVWQADTQALRKSFKLEGRFVYGAMCFSPDGLWLATGSTAGDVDLWHPRTGERVWGCAQHQSHIYTVSFGGDGRHLLSGGDDGLGYLWDLRPRDAKSDKGLETLWAELVGDNSRAAYRAAWDLGERKGEAVEMIAKRLSPIVDIVDPDRSPPSSPAERQQFEASNKRLADHDPGVATYLTVVRAISALEQNPSPEATRAQTVGREET